MSKFQQPSLIMPAFFLSQSGVIADIAFAFGVFSGPSHGVFLMDGEGSDVESEEERQGTEDDRGNDGRTLDEVVEHP